MRLEYFEIFDRLILSNYIEKQLILTNSLINLICNVLNFFLNPI